MIEKMASKVVGQMEIQKIISKANREYYENGKFPLALYDGVG